MHWAIALCMIMLLLTIFLRLTWLNKTNVAGIIQNYLAQTNKSLSPDEAIALAKQIRKPMWNWHIYTGYVLAALFALRLTLPFFGRMKFANPLSSELGLKVKFQYWVYLIFYVCLLISLVTGLMIEFGPKHLKDATEEIHVLSIYYLIAFLILHLGGVLAAEFSSHPGLVSRIISGNKNPKK